SLDAVARLEVFEGAAIERRDSAPAVQYRGRVLPLLELDQLLAGAGGGLPSRGSFHVVVFDDGRRRFGVAVRRILDVIDQALEPADGIGARTTVVQQQVTDLVDLARLLPEP